MESESEKGKRERRGSGGGGGYDAATDDMCLSNAILDAPISGAIQRLTPPKNTTLT